MTEKNALEMTDAEFDQAVRGFAHRAVLAQRKAEETAFMEAFFHKNPDLRPKAADPVEPPATPEPPAAVEPPATPDPVEPPPKTPVSTSSTAVAPAPKPMRNNGALDLSDAEFERAMAHIMATGEVP
jgi:hypothetical protein